MSERAPVKIRLQPMSEADFEESVGWAIPRRAAELVRRNLATEPTSLATSRAEFSELLPEGWRTPGHHFCVVIEEVSGGRVGETWYDLRENGGKVHFWIDWIWIVPEYRRRGFATSVLRRLEEEARKSGADRVGLSVWADNTGAVALYSKLGFLPTMQRMVKALERPPSP